MPENPDSVFVTRLGNVKFVKVQYTVLQYLLIVTAQVRTLVKYSEKIVNPKKTVKIISPKT